jgi:lipopolysaccharide transport system ATP-binding protein
MKSLNMKDDVVIQTEGLYKKFCRNLKRSMYYGTVDIMRSMLRIPYDTGKLRKTEFWALEDINFSLSKGESLGIIGLNGSGKSTLLRMITGIYPPDSGRIFIKGEVSSLIAVGAGFHPHMTGRENIYLNGAILGMSKKEINDRFNDIVDFADIAEFMDAPVSTYSSGMYVRLGFAIAIHSDPDIMLIDEVLSVGDLSFQNKCLRKINDLKRNNKSIIFVSHAMDSVRLVCDRIILLDHGKMIFNGNTDDAIMLYNSRVRDVKLEKFIEENEKNRELNVRADFIEFLGTGIIDNGNNVTKKIQYGENFKVYMDFKATSDIEYPAVAIGIKDERAFNIVYAYNLNYKEVKIPPFQKGQSYRVIVEFKNPNIKPGVYGFNSLITNEKTEELYLHILSKSNDGFRIEDNNNFFIVDGNMYPMGAVIELKSEWSCERINL